MITSGLVMAVCRSANHHVAKTRCLQIELLKGLGVVNDAHQGATVQHLSRVAKDPSQPNLRQVHLIHSELHDELLAKGFALEFGVMGENIVTRGISLLDLPTGTILTLGSTAQVQLTGLRNPCSQLDGIKPGLMAATLDRDAEGGLIRKAGVMCIVLAGGQVQVGDRITADLPQEPHHPLKPV